MFQIGDHVSYPHHGACTIDSIDDGRLTLTFPFGSSLQISVDADRADDVGLRSVIPASEWVDVLDVLHERDVRLPKNWSRRFKNHQEKLKTGDVYAVAEVVRNLAIRLADKGLSTGEKNLRLKAVAILASEMMLSQDVTLEEAETLIAEATKIEE